MVRLRVVLSIAVALALFVHPTAAGAAAPAWAFEPAGWNFGTVMPGTEAAEPARLKLVNTGDVSLRPVLVTLDNRGKGGFKLLSDGCGATVAPGGGCVVEVSFEAQAPGTDEAALEVFEANATVPPAVARLTGIGTMSTVSIDPATIDFGTVPVFGARPTRTVTLTNLGPSTLTIAEMEVFAFAGGVPARPLASPIRWTRGTCEWGTSLKPGGTCAINVEFEPDEPGVYSAEMVVTDNALDSPQRILVSGTATVQVTPPGPPKPEEPRSTLLGHPAARTRSRSATFTFTGNSTAAGFGCRLDRGPFRACTSPVRYGPLNVGHHQFTVRATSSDGTQTIGAYWNWRIVKKERGGHRRGAASTKRPGG